MEIYLDVESIKEAFEDGINEVFEDTTKHGIEKVWVGSKNALKTVKFILMLRTLKRLLRME